MTVQKQTVLMAAAQPTVATGGTTPHLASGSSTALVEVATHFDSIGASEEVMPQRTGHCLRASTRHPSLHQQSLAEAVSLFTEGSSDESPKRGRLDALRRHSTLLGRRRAT